MKKSKLNILIPMAGEGSRFKDAGFKEPKPFVDVSGVPMILRVYNNLKPKREHQFIFICRVEHLSKMKKIFKGEPVKFITVDQLTKGALCTTLFAREYIDNSDKLLIAACDQIVNIDIDEFLDYCYDLDGCSITFECTKNNHSYCKTRKDKIVKVAEKQVISNHANVGIYYFGSGMSYCTAAEKMLDLKDTFNGEYYIAPVYNHLIINNSKIYEIDKKYIHTIGTPYELRQYLGRCR